jgi:hypothetical protein
VPASLKATQKHRKEFEEFHSNKGVRTVQGDIGPTKGVRMLLKAGYRHVYISRAFAQANGFIPAGTFLLHPAPLPRVVLWLNIDPLP